ncbi:FAD-binding domain-containing protein [Thermoleptolyngbya sp. C42_A2020_037]|uniref:FAD-binding domain-containing protein n=1 Tax=Thermoleptolyngbya sp. C42_A2020_037 TaxID=2747799 RepID=UPI0019DB36D9|nr:FAD-binding domain-containing protein [Thermoleptolyngbya sp. C42_A2020_037]MBF2083158.1 deoxyribodipyrimidine photo-lyase [Thermoleptolyngbya sp. C42_A2020_037]
MSELILFWHRRDLRIADNVGLSEGRLRSAKVIGVFCLDPGLLQRDDVAPVRVAYLLGCLQDLQTRYAKAGSQLLILHDDPVKAMPRLANALGAQSVYWNRDVEPYGRERDRQVAAALKEAGIEYQAFWDQLLHDPKSILSGSGTPYTVYTPFWKNWSSKPKAEPVADLKNAEGLTDSEKDAATKAGAIALPKLKDLGLVWDGGFVLEPGEAAAQERLTEFCDRAMTDYQEQRNFPFVDGTSRLSAALKFGAIGIRTVWAATQTAQEQTRSDEAQEGIRVWRQELAWREFYQHVLYHFPELADGPYREPFKDFPWENNEQHFHAWCEGRTGYPIVDAAMRQLNETGWMHNRCRMIVASFLTKDLIIDWRWGEKYFMQRLIDGDLAANNGGWQWSASSGMDPKPLRIFNPASQAQKFDPEAEYIREWLPELRGLETGLLVTGNIDAGDRRSCNYPAPIVDHKKRQALFKQRYANAKGNKKV